MITRQFPEIAPHRVSQALIIALIVGLSGLFSLALAGGAWIPAGMIAGLVGYGVLLTFGVRTIAILWIIGSPTFFVFFNNVLGRIPFFTMERFSFLTLAGVIAALHVFGKKKSLPFNEIERIMALFLLYAAGLLIVSTAGAGSDTMRTDVALYANGYLLPLGAFFIARRIAWSHADIERLLLFLVGAGAFLAGIGVLQVYLGLETFVPKDMDMTHAGIRDGRATGVFASAGEYGAVLAALALAGMVQYKRVRDPVLKLLFLALTLLMVVGLVLGKTRAPWLGCLVGMGVLFVLDKSYRPVFFTAALAGAAATLAALPFLADSQLTADLTRRLTELSPIYNRLTLWASGVNMAVHNPLGVGFGRYAFMDALPEYITGFGAVSAHWATSATVPHNEYIHILVLTGLPGITMFLLIITRILKMLRRTFAGLAENSLQKDLCILAIASLAVFLVNGLAIDYGNWKYFSILVFFLLGAVQTFAAKPPTPKGNEGAATTHG